MVRSQACFPPEADQLGFEASAWRLRTATTLRDVPGMLQCRVVVVLSQRWEPAGVDGRHVNAGALPVESSGKIHPLYRLGILCSTQESALSSCRGYLWRSVRIATSNPGRYVATQGVNGLFIATTFHRYSFWRKCHRDCRCGRLHGG